MCSLFPSQSSRLPVLLPILVGLVLTLGARRPRKGGLTSHSVVMKEVMVIPCRIEYGEDERVQLIIRRLRGNEKQESTLLTLKAKKLSQDPKKD